MNGGPPCKDEAALRRDLDLVRALAERHGLELGAVVVVPPEMLQNGDMDAITAAVSRVRDLLGATGITAAPPSDEFLPPVVELLPGEKKGKKAPAAGERKGDGKKAGEKPGKKTAGKG